MDKKKIKNNLLSNENIEKILSIGKWDERGSSLDIFFDDYIEDLISGISRKFILKDYISKKISKIFFDIEKEGAKTLYRAMYVKGVISEFPGIYWSSNPKTKPYVEKPEGFNEVLIFTDFNKDIIDWEQTILARLDYVFGDSEKEYRIKKDIGSISFKIK